jgi:gliding motility-associated-like protein
MNKPLRFFILAVVIFIVNQINIFGQTTILQHDIDWTTHDQNMWGPNGNPFSIDIDINLFSVEFDTAISVGSITNVIGGQLGAMVDIDTWFKIGSDFVISGFTTGSVDVDYPVSIFLEIPDDNSFCPGDSVTISSWYEVRPGWKLDTHFPTAGIIALTMDFGFDLDVDATICVFSCTTIPVIDVHVPYDTITIIGLNSQTGVFSYPCYDPNNFPPFAICNDTILPIVFDNLFGIGLSGSVTLPYVETTDYIDISDPCHKNLYADGDSTWIWLEVDVVQFLSAIAGLIPPPQGPAIQQFLQNLSGTIDLGLGFSIYYNLFSAWFDINSTMKQNFTFEPYVWNHLSFPVPVDFVITDPSTGHQVETGSESNVDFLACHNLTYQWPCFDHPSMDIGIRHSLGNDFTNHTWDSLAFSFTIQALHFIIDLPIFLTTAVPDVPELCITVLTDSVEMISEEICMPVLQTSTQSALQPDIQIVIGPLIDYTWPLGYIPITWFNQTWELAGFHDTIFPPFSMSTYCPPFLLNGHQTVDVLCYGQATGTATVYVDNGKPPYTYDWSDGHSETTTATSSTHSNLISGIYYISITDANGCELIDSLEILDAFPPLVIDFNVVDITCTGGNDGSITLNVSGGLPPYQYVWDPPAGNTHAIGGLAAGTYSVTVTDANNCDTTLTLTLIELYPLPPVDFYAEPLQGCQPLTVQFHETSPDEGQTYLWNFGNSGGFSNQKDPLYTYTNYGIFNVTLTVTSIHGCESVLSMNDYIEVYRKPLAQFTYSPAHPDIVNSSVYFYNQSTSTYACEWSFGDGHFSTLTNPYHHYTDTGYFHVVLIVETEHGCQDTAEAHIRVKDIYSIYIPNAFTPDGDGLNEEFSPLTRNLDPDQYIMRIFDRWGQMLFETTDINVGWDGTYNGKPCWTGAYVYDISYVDMDGILRKETGSVNLIR